MWDIWRWYDNDDGDDDVIDDDDDDVNDACQQDISKPIVVSMLFIYILF